MLLLLLLLLLLYLEETRIRDPCLQCLQAKVGDANLPSRQSIVSPSRVVVGRCVRRIPRTTSYTE